MLLLWCGDHAERSQGREAGRHQIAMTFAAVGHRPLYAKPGSLGPVGFLAAAVADRTVAVMVG